MSVKSQHQSGSSLLSFQLYDMPHLQEVYVKNNKFMKQADLIIKFGEAQFGLLSEIVCGSSRTIHELNSHGQEQNQKQSGPITIEVDNYFDPILFENFIKLFFGYTVHIKNQDLFAFLKIGDYFGIGQATCSNPSKDKYTFHEVLFIHAMKFMSQLNYVEAWDYLANVNLRQSIIESFTVRRQQIRSLSNQLFSQLEGFFIQESYKPLLAYFQILLKNEKKEFQDKIFTVLDVRRESYIQLRQRFHEFLQQTNELKEKNGWNKDDEELKQIKLLFEELDGKFNLQGVYNKEIDKIRTDIDLLQNRVNISTDAMVRELKQNNEKIARVNADLREKCEVINNQCQFFKEKLIKLISNRISLVQQIDQYGLALCYTNGQIEIIQQQGDLQFTIEQDDNYGEIQAIDILNKKLVVVYSKGQVGEWAINDQKQKLNIYIKQINKFTDFKVIQNQYLCFSRPKGIIEFYNTKGQLLTSINSNENQTNIYKLYYHQNMGNLFAAFDDTNITLISVQNLDKDKIVCQNSFQIELQSTANISVVQNHQNLTQILLIGSEDNLIQIVNLEKKTTLSLIKLDGAPSGFLSSIPSLPSGFLVTNNCGVLQLYQFNDQLSPQFLDQIQVEYNPAVSTNLYIVNSLRKDSYLLFDSSSTHTITVNIQKEKLYNLQISNLINYTQLSGHNAPVYSICHLKCNPNFIATGSDDKTIKIWKLQTGQLFKTLTGHSAYVRVIKVLQDPRYFASASFDCQIIVWDCETFEQTIVLSGHTKPILSMAVVEREQEVIISGGEDQLLKIWNWKDGSLIQQINMNKNEVWSLLSIDDTIISGHKDGTIKIIKYLDNVIERELKGHKNYINALLDLKVTSLIASGSSDLLINIWNYHTGQILKSLKGHSDIVWDLAILKDPFHIASCGKDGKIQLWNWNKGYCASTKQSTTKGSVYKLLGFEKDNFLISGNSDGTVTVYQLEKHEAQIHFKLMKLSQFQLN